jgi:TolB protein
LVYTTYYKTGFPDIYKIDLGSGSKTPIATFKGTNTGATFSPDGRQIAMTLSGTGNSEIYVSDSRGKNMRRLTTNKSLEASPSWSPDGRRLVYTSDAPGRPQLFEISSTGGPARRLPTNISSYCAEPVWNPTDESQIAFTAAVSGGFQIALYDTKTRTSKILTRGASSLEPAWLRDGRHIVFTRRDGANTRLMLLDTVSEKVSPLHNPSFGDTSSASYVY